MKDLRLSINRGETTTCFLSADLVIPFGKAPAKKTIEFKLSAEHNDGWDVKAEMDGEIEIADLIEKFAKGNDAPSVLKDFKFGDIKLSFNTKSSDKHLSGSGKFKLDQPLNTTEADLILKIDITHPQAGQIQTDFSGHLEIVPDENKKDEKLIFDLVFDKNTKDTFIAGYHDETNKGLNLAGLLEGFGVPGMQDLNLAVKDVYFVKYGDKILLHSDVNAALNILGLGWETASKR